jgi:two-component system, OmpR family, phosphate regulon sensor histidine kinase PhoR
MIDEYLDITRLESGARLLQPAPVCIESLLERVLLLLDPVAAQRQIRLARRFAPNLPTLVADGDLLSRAVTNLVANAIKFSPAKSEVRVAARAEDDAVWIEVSDRGCGIPPESLPRIFEKFYRVPRVEEGEAPGTGLGLAFVREIAEMHGGRILAQSETGVGSVFSLKLPLNES